MVNINKEGFVGARLSSGDLRGYFFYLTYSKRAESYSSNRSVDNNFNYNGNNLDTFYRYTAFRNSQLTKRDINSVELVLSYSSKMNLLLGLINGVKEWEEKQTTFVYKLLEEKMSNSVGFLAFKHRLDSTGYRLHFHVLIMPYNASDDVILNKNINYVKRTLEKAVLEDIKKEFRLFIKDEYSKISDHDKKNAFNLISKYKKPTKAKIFKSEPNIQYFIDMNLKLTEKLEIEEQKAIIANGELKSESIINALYLSRYDKDLFKIISKAYSASELLEFVNESSSKSIIHYLFLDFYTELLNQNIISFPDFLIIYEEHRKKLIGEAKVVFEEQVHSYFSDDNLFEKDIKEKLENNFTKSSALSEDMCYNTDKKDKKGVKK